MSGSECACLHELKGPPRHAKDRIELSYTLLGLLDAGLATSLLRGLLPTGLQCVVPL